MAQAVVSLSDLDEILSTIIRIIPILVGVERCILYVWDASREVYVFNHGFGLNKEAVTRLTTLEFTKGNYPMMDLAREQNQPTVYILKPNDVPEKWMKFKPAEENEKAMIVGERLLISIPLLIKSDLFGVLLIEEGEGARRFRSRRLEIVNGIAQEIALAIQNDRLQDELVVRERLETEIQLARQIQETFIPETLPQHLGWELAARWKTARQVGGDFYDVIKLPDNKLGIIIADVADKGVPAALFMALTRTLVRAAVAEKLPPSGVLKRVNDLLIPDTRQGMFVTAVYGVLDQETCEFTYANAGHNPPLWIHSSGQIEKLIRTGIALGVTYSNPMSQRTIMLNTGESLLLYTDGLTEAFSPEGILFGDSRLLDAVRSDRSSSASGLLDSVESRLNDFIGLQPLSDDLTLLVIRYK